MGFPLGVIHQDQASKGFLTQPLTYPNPFPRWNTTLFKPGFSIGSHWIYLFLLKPWDFFHWEGITMDYHKLLPSRSPVSTRNRAGWGVCLCTAMPPRVTQKLLPRNWPPGATENSEKQRLTQKKPQLRWSVIGTNTVSTHYLIFIRLRLRWYKYLMNYQSLIWWLLSHSSSPHDLPAGNSIQPCRPGNPNCSWE